MLRDPNGNKSSIFTMYCDYYQRLYEAVELIETYRYSIEDALAEMGFEKDDLQEEDLWYLENLAEEGDTAYYV